MNINADFTRRAAVHGDDAAWLPSPMPGVERRMLDRIGDEVARATTIVRYAANSRFSAHTHTGGEEFLVLEGVFEDEHGSYPVGTYVRNPPGSKHSPRAPKGTTIFVKLCQFDPDDRTHLTINTLARVPQPVADRPGVHEIPLHADAYETVRIELWRPGATIRLKDHDGLEVLVLSGTFSEGGEDFALNDWLRLPPGTALEAKAGDQGARLFVKSGHLAAPQTAPQTAPNPAPGA